MASIHQQNVTDYHASVEQAGHHHGGEHNMHLFHSQWHQNNPRPARPTHQDANWAIADDYGTRFLQMHHEMVSAAPGEPHTVMMHDSIVTWYGNQGVVPPANWIPSTTIPLELGYQPDIEAYPEPIKTIVSNFAASQGQTPAEFLTRNTDTPGFTLPGWFTLGGVGQGAAGDPFTGARKLADFKNVNQLGCCMVFPHDAWHGRIGGAMGSTLTAIADPIFYFGVHWHIDKVYTAFKALQAQQPHLHPADAEELGDHPPRVGGTEGPAATRPFTAAEQLQVDQWQEASRQFHALE